MRDKFGAAMAEKATDALCRALVAPTARAARAEAGEPRSAIIEITEAALEETQPRGASAGKDDWLTRQPASLAARRGAFERSISSLVAEIGGRRGAARATVTTCWLARALRTPWMPGVLAELAEREQVERIDLPSALRREIQGTTGVVGAPGFRLRHALDGAGVVVAILDGEVDSAHPCFGTRVSNRANFTLEPSVSPDAHGTAVAGIVGSSDPTYSGVAPGVTLFGYKILATDERLNADDFGGALALQQALEEGARVANCSWGAGPAAAGTSREARACDAAWALGMIVVKSAGNRGPGSGTLTTPADAQGVIVVGATTRDGRAIASYSSRGPTADGRGRPHLAAPGGHGGAGVWSARPGGGFGDVGYGTSYAAPHVSGLAALLLAKNPLLTPDQVRATLLASCQPLAGWSANDQGAGLVSIP